MAAAELAAGDLVVTAEGGWREVEGVAFGVGPAWVHNLTVEEKHTFFVGEEGAWVHNCPKSGGGTSGGRPALPGDDFHPDLVEERIASGAHDNGPLAAKAGGFERTNYRSHGQPVYSDGRRFITPDVDGHNGGAWKAADSVQGLGSKTTRLGTYDREMNRIGD